MEARFFATPTAVKDWMSIIAPGCTREEALEDLLDWSSDAVRCDTGYLNGLARYKARKPLRCFFAVDEGQYPLPAITAVNKPHAQWVPGGFSR